jgi:hypothetical protein
MNTTLTARRKVELVIGFWASLALTIWALKEFTG